MYYTYMLRCIDNSIYTGITNDINRRMKEHFTKNKKCAKYTMNHSAKELVAVFESNNRVLASKLEFHIKSLNKLQKQKLIDTNDLSILKDKIDPNSYKRIELANFLKV